MELKNFYAQDVNGNIVPGAACTVYLEDRVTLATGLQDAAGAALANPFTADVNGLAQFAAPNGKYYFRCVAGLLDSQIAVQFADPSQIYPLIFQAQASADSAAASAAAAAASAAAIVQVPDYAALRAYTGSAAIVQVTNPLISGAFPLSSIAGTDDGGTVIIDTLGRTRRRDYSGAINVAWFGASTGIDSTAAFASAYAASQVGGVIIVPGPGPYTIGTIPFSKEVSWEIGFDTATNLALLNLPAAVRSKLGVAASLWRGNSQPDEFAVARFDRVANHSGGTPGSVSSNIRAKTAVSRGNTNFEWVATFQLDNNGAGENVAVYAQALRSSPSAFTPGGTFATLSEARDLTQEVDPTTALVAHEIDILANGTDANYLRIGSDYVAGKGVAAGSTCEAGYAIRIGASNGNPANGYWKTGVLLQHRKIVGIQVKGQTDVYSFESLDTAVAAHRLGGTYSDSAQIIDGTAVVGTRYSGTFTNNNAIRFNSGMAIAWEATAQIRQLFSGGRMQFVNAGTEKTGFDTTTGAMFVTGTQVVGPRKIGWAADTGTAKRTSSATFSQTAPASYTQASQQAVNDALAAVTQAMKALKDDLLSTTGHGLIGA